MKTKSIFLSFLVLALLAFSNLAEAKLKITPSPLNCSDTRVGQESDCTNIEVSNTSYVFSVNITDIYIGDNENFTVDTSDCEWATIRTRESCIIPVIFNPTLKRDFDSSLTVHYYDFYSKNRSAFSDIYGRGIAPIVSLSTDILDFGDQTVNTSSWQYVVMRNIGSDTLNISNIIAPLGSAFRVSSDCGDTLEAASSCTIQVFFEPTAEREYTTNVQINDDAEDSPQLIEVSGTGIAAGQPDVNLDKTVINFGNKAVSSTNTDTITVNNTETVALTITSIVATGTSYSQTNDCGAGLDIGGSCTITVTFLPATVGSFSGTITLNDNATDTPQTVSLSGKGVSPNATLVPDVIEFGNQTINKSSAEHEVILLNSGTSDLTITNIQTSSTVYTQTNNCSETLEPQESCLINVTFSPTETGFVGGSLSVYDDDPGGSPQTVFLFGTGITGPDLDLVPSLHDFGNVNVGDISQPQDFEVTNTGEGTLSIYSITANSDFAQTNDCPATLEEEETCIIEATFIPTVSGNFFGLLSVSDDATGSPHVANMWGYGTSSDITLLPASINFGNQTINKSSLAYDVRFLNNGNSAITITSIDTGSTVFTQTNDCGSTLEPTAYCTISVTFSPTSLGEINGEVTITDSASGSPHNIDLMGTGIDPIYPDIDISPNFWDFGNVLVGDTSETKTFTVKNTGVVDVVISSIDTNSEFAQTNDCPATLKLPFYQTERSLDESCAV